MLQPWPKYMSVVFFFSFLIIILLATESLFIMSVWVWYWRSCAVVFWHLTSLLNGLALYWKEKRREEKLLPEYISAFKRDKWDPQIEDEIYCFHIPQTMNFKTPSCCCTKQFFSSWHSILFLHAPIMQFSPKKKGWMIKVNLIPIHIIYTQYSSHCFFGVSVSLLEQEIEVLIRTIHSASLHKSSLWLHLHQVIDWL